MTKQTITIEADEDTINYLVDTLEHLADGLKSSWQDAHGKRNNAIAKGLYETRGQMIDQGFYGLPNITA